jgi:DNA-binding PadR family transcriptional regulator
MHHRHHNHSHSHQGRGACGDPVGHAGHGDSCARAFHHPPFGRRGFKHPFGPGGGHMQAFAAMAGHHGRARRGDVRTAVLRLLAEAPMHGYQIIQELSARSEGTWTPSAGSVYPTLQQLADEGLIIAEETSGKKVFSLTDAGTEAVAALADQPAPWEDSSAGAGPSVAGGYREAATRLAQVMWQIGTTGSEEQVSKATEIITEARKKLYAMLAED